jgi:hypothetical protein
MSDIVKRFLERWKALAGHVATFQARLIVTIIYVLLAAPVSLALKAVADPLRLRRPRESDKTSMWIPRETAAPTVEEAKRQF